MTYTKREKQILGLASCMLNCSTAQNGDVIRMIDALDKAAEGETKNVWRSATENSKGTTVGLIRILDELSRQ